MTTTLHITQPKEGWYTIEQRWLADGTQFTQLDFISSDKCEKPKEDFCYWFGIEKLIEMSLNGAKIYG